PLTFLTSISFSLLIFSFSLFFSSSSLFSFFLLLLPPPPSSTLFPYTTLFRSGVYMSGFTWELITSGGRFSMKYESKVPRRAQMRSEEHTSELQSRFDLVCRLLLEKKK